MPDLDDVLRSALRDDGWEPATEQARREVQRRHRRGTVLRRYVTASAAASAAVVLSLAWGDGAPTRGADPASPTATTTAPPSAASPLQGRWRSGSLGPGDVRAAARAAGAPEAAATMVADLPRGRFRVVLDVRGASLTTYVERPGGVRVVLDKESLAVADDIVTLRPFAVAAESVHAWEVTADRLTLGFRSTTEGVEGGVPGEAWQRLLYDSSTFVRLT